MGLKLYTTILDFGYEKHRFPGALDRRLCEYLIEIYSKEGDLVLDPFCGSGVVLQVAKELGRRAVGADLSPAFKWNVVEADSCRLPFKSGCADFVLAHPPYWDAIRYSSHSADFSRKSLDAYYRSLSGSILEIKRTLRGGGYCALVLGDRKKGRRLYAIHAKAIELAERAGLILEDVLIWKLNSTRFYRTWLANRPHIIVHNYVLILRN